MSINLPTPNLPKGLYIPQMYLRQPTADVPAYKPMIVPPADLERPEETQAEETKEEQVEAPTLKIPVIDIQMPLPEPAVVITAVTTAVVAVATTSVTSSLFEPIKKKVQKQLQAKVNKWKENRKKKKGLLGKLKDAAEDQEHQIQILGTFVRLGVVVWSGFIITMNYVEIPMVKKSGNSDITFVASVFTGALATFGLSTGNSKDKGKPINCPMTKKKEE